MATQTKTLQQAALDRVLERGRRDTERARELLEGDPSEAFDQFIRDTYSYEDVVEMHRFLIEGEDEDEHIDVTYAR